MGTRYLIDTNIAIYFLDGFLPDGAKNWVLNALNTSSNLSIITKIELLSKPGNAEQESTLGTFLNNSTIH
jgi:predicted nucleic acid-binding protein